MPNGFVGTDAEWRRLEAPLLQLDPILEAYAGHRRLRLTRNYHNWPERSLTWGRLIKRTIQISLEDEEALTWSIWLSAWRDRRGKRYWKNEYLHRGVPISTIAEHLESLLDAAHDKIDTWGIDDLEFATDLRGA